MKITKAQLRKIIKEEMDSQNLDEIFGFGKRDTSNDSMRDYDFSLDEVPAKISVDVFDHNNKLDGDFQIGFELKGKYVWLTGKIDQDSLETLVDKHGFKPQK